MECVTLHISHYSWISQRSRVQKLFLIRGGWLEERRPDLGSSATAASTPALVHSTLGISTSLILDPDPDLRISASFDIYFLLLLLIIILTKIILIHIGACQGKAGGFEEKDCSSKKRGWGAAGGDSSQSFWKSCRNHNLDIFKNKKLPQSIWCGSAQLNVSFNYQPAL